MSQADAIAASAIFWGVVLILAIIALGGAVWLVRRWAISASTRGDDAAWSLQHLRDMKEQGRITEEEFEALRFKALGAPRSAAGGQERARSAGDRRSD